MNNTGKIIQKSRELLAWEKDYSININYPNSLSSHYISSELYKRMYGDAIALDIHPSEWDNIDDYKNNVQEIKKLFADILYCHAKEVRHYLRDLEKCRDARMEAKNLLDTLWPECCEIFKNKLIYDTYGIKPGYIFRLAISISGGVYFLWGENGLDYIGQSKNVVKRLSSAHHPFICGEHVIGIIPVEQEQDRLEIEAALINMCHPRLNVAHKRLQLSLIKTPIIGGYRYGNS